MSPLFWLLGLLFVAASGDKADAPALDEVPPNPLAQQYITERNNIVRTAVAQKWSKAKLAQALQLHTASWKQRASANDLIEWSIVAATVAQHDAATRYA